MKKLPYIIILLLTGVMTACNDEVFVSRPPVEIPDNSDDPDDPDTPDDPYDAGVFMLASIKYNESSLTLGPYEQSFTTGTTFINNGPKAIDVTVLFDNYNGSIVQISNTTYYAIPWAPADEQPCVPIPGLDSDGNPGFYGQEIPFAFGKSILPYQYMAGHTESFSLPAYSKVKADVTVTRCCMEAKADIKYYMSNFPESLDNGWVVVSVQVPVKIQVEWSEVTPATES